MAEDRNSAVDQIKASGWQNIKNTAAEGLQNSALSKQSAWQDYYQSLQQAANQEALLRQGADIDLTQGLQDGSFDLLKTLINQGYIDEGQRDAAQGRYSNVLDQLQQAFGPAQQYALTGGYDDNEYNTLLDGYNQVYGNAAEVASRGALRQDEYDRSLASARQDVLDRYKSAAESGFNARVNPGAATFGGMSVMAQGARDAGANQAAVRAGLDQFQAQTRMQGNDAMRGTLDSASGLVGDRAGNRVGALDQLGRLIDSGASISDSMAELDTSTMSSNYGGLQDYATSNLQKLADVQDTFNKKGKKTGSQVTTPYSGGDTPWNTNNVPYAPGFYEYPGGDPNSAGKKKNPLFGAFAR